MWPLLITGAGAWIISEIIKEWGWSRDLSKKDIEHLPEAPGAYILYNRVNNIIHIGSTGDLYRRISKHEKRNKIHSIDFLEVKTFNEAYGVEMNFTKNSTTRGAKISMETCSIMCSLVTG